MRKALVMLAVLVSALWAAPALAESSPKLDLAAWVSQNTDLTASQIAIAGPDNVYSLEPLGPRLPTGEVLALVRTEAVMAEWRATHQFQSWDAHLLFDCQGGRVRVLRSASYAEHDRGGAAKADERGDAWFSPQAKTPAATLLAAACDSAFSWPLRGTSSAPRTASPGPRTSVVQTAVAEPAMPQEPVHIERAALAPLADARPEVVVMVADSVSAPATRGYEMAASPEMAQFTSAATATLADRRIQSEASFTAPAGREPMLFSRVAAAGRTCRRLAGLGSNWVLRRLEVAFRQEPASPRLEPGLIRQAQAY